VAAIKMAYIGGGSTRAPGTMASMIHQGENFNGSEVVLIDLNEERLQLVKTMTEKMARDQGIDFKVTATTDRKSGLQDCDAVLTSFRPGGFEARYLDESIPLKYGVIGQETQGPGGFFMALRSVHVMKDILKDMETACPNARIFNYTNPINIVSEAITHNSPFPIVSLCEGPIVFPKWLAFIAGLDPELVDANMIGLNHGSWTVRHKYNGSDMMPLLREAYDRKKNEPTQDLHDLRMLQLATTMDSIPNFYFQYYHFNEELLAELQAKPTTRSQDIMAEVPDYWKHYTEQALSDHPHLDPKRSRGGIHELELAFDVMDAYYNDKKEIWPCNVTNNGAIREFPDDLVVEVPCYVDKNGIVPLMQDPMPQHTVGLVKMLGEYQSLAGKAAWDGNRKDAIRALSSHPFIRSLNKAEAIYDEMAGALKAYLPDRLFR